MVADRRQIASVLLGLISSLSACMQLNVALLNAEISHTRRRLDTSKLFTLSTAQNGRQEESNEENRTRSRHIVEGSFVGVLYFGWPNQPSSGTMRTLHWDVIFMLHIS